VRDVVCDDAPVSPSRSVIVATLSICKSARIARLGRTPQAHWKAAFLAYFDTGQANHSGTEAINGLIQLDCRVRPRLRRRDNYRLRRCSSVAVSTAEPAASKKRREPPIRTRLRRRLGGVRP
jgi:hypothetical protein